MSEIPKLLIIDYSDYPIRNFVDVMLLIDELETIAEEYKGYLPVFRILNIEGEYGEA